MRNPQASSHGQNPLKENFITPPSNPAFVADSIVIDFLSDEVKNAPRATLMPMTSISSIFGEKNVQDGAKAPKTIIQKNTHSPTNNSRSKSIAGSISKSIQTLNHRSSNTTSSTLYSSDLVLIFPKRSGGEQKNPNKFSQDRFIKKMLGLTTQKSKKEDYIQDELRTIFRTDRCFTADESNAFESEKSTSMSVSKKIDSLRKEYEAFVGSSANTTEVIFCELIATAIARRIQIACGLTTYMFESCREEMVCKYGTLYLNLQYLNVILL